VKVALYPLHTWKPDAYAAAPTGVTALLAALVSTVAAYALLRLLLSAFTVEFLSRFPAVRTLLLVAATVSVVAGSVLALRERHVARFLAYSSIAQFGLVLVGLSVANATSVTGATVHLVGHAVVKAGFFVLAGIVAARFGAETVDEYAGLAARSPYLAGVVVVLALTLIGIPPSVGFVGKLYIALGAAEAGSWAGVGVVAVSTLLSLAYFTALLQRTLGDPEPAVEGDRATRPAAEAPSDARPTAPTAVTAGMLSGTGLAVAGAVGLGFLATAYGALLAPTLGGLL
jgi:multicomponent Na+:H+ antiporter subunit D